CSDRVRPPCRAGIIVYSANLSGPAESPPNASPGLGSATVTYDNVLHTLRVQALFSGLLGTTTASHIHASTLVPGVGTAGVAATPTPDAPEPPPGSASAASPCGSRSG